MPAKLDRVKLGRTAKRRGGDNERRLARRINRWWTPNLPEQLGKAEWADLVAVEWQFRKSPGSGGMDKYKYPGDISKPDDCPFVFEAKWRKEVPHVESLLTSDKSLLKAWLLGEERKLADKVRSPLDVPLIWLLFKKRDTEHDYVMMRQEVWEWIHEQTDTVSNLPYLLYGNLLHSGDFGFIIFALEDLLSAISADGLRWND